MSVVTDKYDEGMDFRDSNGKKGRPAVRLLGPQSALAIIFPYSDRSLHKQTADMIKLIKLMILTKSRDLKTCYCC